MWKMPVLVMDISPVQDAEDGSWTGAMLHPYLSGGPIKADGFYVVGVHRGFSPVKGESGRRRQLS